VQARIAGYCERYGVKSRGAGAVPPFPTGRRETRQHREWVVLYKAVQRLQRRAAAADPARRASALKSQRGRCLVCLESADVETAVLVERAGGRAAVLHPACADLLRLVDRLGPAVLDRLRALAPPHD